MDRASEQLYPDVPYDPQLIDATYALLLNNHGDPLVIPALNRDGDCLSDMVLQLFGSIAGAESMLISFDDELNPHVVMAEAPHGTAKNSLAKHRQPDGDDFSRRFSVTYFNDKKAITASAPLRATVNRSRKGTLARQTRRRCQRRPS